RYDPSRIREVERLGLKREVAVARSLAHLEAEQPGRLVDGGVRMLRADDDAAAVRLARGGECRDRRDRGAVLDVPVPARWETEELRRPIQRQELELRRRRRGAPEKGDRVQRRRKQLREDARLGCTVRE